MRKLGWTMGCALTAVAACATPLAAQMDDTHQGFWIGSGGGGGWSAGRGAAWYLRMGGTPHDRVQFGGEAIVWWREAGPGNDQTRESVTATALIYPFYRTTAEPGLFREWFVKTGFGVAAGEFGAGADAEGVGTNVATGFHFRLGRKFFVTTTFDFMLQFYETRTVTASLFTVGFSWH